MSRSDKVIVHGAIIHTMDAETPQANALAFSDGRFRMVGDADEILNAWPDARRIDASGCTIIPGLIDAHAHVLPLGESLMQANLSNARSADELVRILVDHAEKNPFGDWIIGRGWDEARWEDGRIPHREILDNSFSERPVFLIRIDHHSAWVNSAALRMVDNLSEIDDPPGGRIVRDGKGRATGILVDSAMRLIADLLPEPSREYQDEALQKALREMNRHGLTGVHDATISAKELATFRRSLNNGTFSIRLNGMIDGPGKLFDRVCQEGPIVEDRLVVRTLKLFADGALGSRGAAMLADFSDDPGNRGLLMYEEDRFDELVLQAVCAGLQVATHAIGDASVRFVLDSYERVIGRSNGRHRIEHVQVIHPTDIARLGELNLIASMQPVHFAEDRSWAPDRLGSERFNSAYAWKKIQESGARLAFGSDFPIAPVSPLEGFAAAVDLLTGDQRAVSREVALRAFTLDAAYAAFMDDEIGSISPGKRADFVVLDTDIMTAPLESIPETSIFAVWLDGEAVGFNWQ